MRPIQDPVIRHYRRSPFLVAEWGDGELILRNSDTMRRFRADAGVLTLLSSLHRSRSLADLHSAGLSVTEGDLERLAEASIVERAATADDALVSYPGCWSAAELAVQRNSNSGGYRPSEVEARAIPPPVAFKPTADEGLLPLPLPTTTMTCSRSISDGLARPKRPPDRPARAPSLDELATMLHQAARVQRHFTGGDLGEHALRPFASGGARSELEIYVVTRAVVGVAHGSHRYDPRRHALQPVREWDDTHADLLTRAGADPDIEVLILVTAVFARVMWKYQGLGLSLIYKDAGCLFRAMELVAANMDLIPRVIGEGEEEAVTSLLRLDPLEESSVGYVLLGGPATDVTPAD